MIICSVVSTQTGIARYDVLRSLGEGGFVSTYLARDSESGKDVVLKLCAVADDRLRRRFLDELEIATRLDHPNVVPTLDYGRTEGDSCFVVQELLDGEDLRAKIAARSGTYPERLRYLFETAQALAYAHSLGVLHRDVKPGNVRVRVDGTAQVRDFGLAKLEREVTPLDRIGGSDGGYVAPEQMLG
ncbi:MAG: serine/threonine-protein kinase, partial [Thermoanaerobaculia bacterium]|nr:serine/threonine-protein kinase [Thermoanaerobaculia bacterium]